MKKTGILVCLGLTLTGNAQVNLLTNLQACYPLDCPTNSVVVNGAATGTTLNGTLMGNVTCTTGHTGLPNTALKFGGGINDYVKLVNSPLIKPTTSLTVSGWFYLTSLNLADLVFAKNTCNFNFNAISIITDNGTFQIYKRPGSPGSCGAGSFAASSAFSLNTWHHVVFYADNSVLKVVVDNNTPVVTTHTIVFDYDPSVAVILGGSNQTAANNPYTGRMDDLKFWNRQLTPAEITVLYNYNPLCNQSGASPTTTFTASKQQICIGQVITFIDQSANNPSSFSWQFPGGSPATSTISNPVVTYSSPGTYTVTLITSNSFGPGAAVTKTLTVSECTAISETKNIVDNLFVYPNPANDKIYIDNLREHSAVVKDVTGKDVLYITSGTDATPVEINVEDQPAGFYFVNFIDAKGNHLKPQKLILTR